ncbi:MAG: CsgG/HfaB family protein [Spirochaetales bacterium]|nr:CsgG/HfaB family protein [Spirochaetales bacterium]
MKKLILLLLISIMLLTSLSAKAVSYDEFIADAADLFSAYIGKKTSVFVMPLDGATDQFNTEFVGDLCNALINRDCIVLDRQNTEAIIEELKFQTSGLVDDKKAVSIGHMMGAELLITGSVSNTVSSYEIELRLIDIETTLVRRISEWNIKYDSNLKNIITGGASGVGSQKISIGLRAGGMYSFSTPHEDMVGTGVNPVVKNNPLFNASAFVNYKLLDQLKIQTEVMLSLNNSMNISGMGTPDTTITYSTLEVPLLISYAVVRHPVVAEIYGGAYISLPVSDIDIQMKSIGKGSVKLTGTTLGITAGICVSKSMGPGYIIADVRYINDFDSLKIDGKFESKVGTGESATTVVVDLKGKKICTRRGVLATVGYAFSL